MSNSPHDREEFERCYEHGQLLEASQNTLWLMLKDGQVQFEGRTVLMVLALPYRETAATERWEQYDERSQAECDAYIRFYHRWLRSLGPVNENTIWYEAHVRGKAAAQQAPNFLTDTTFAQ